MPRIVHFNLPADDVERAMGFYSTVFGWTFQAGMGVRPYWLATTGPDDTPGINGTIFPRENGQPAGLCNVVSVPSVDEAIASIEAAGGTIHLRNTPIPGIGWLAIATDTEANVFSMLHPDQSAA